MADEPAEFDPVAIIAALERSGVAHVVIGGIAARIAGAPIVTGDLDLTPAATDENLKRLEAALAQLGARSRTGSVTTDELVTAEVLSDNDLVQAATPFGDLDIVMRPAGTRGYEDLVRGSRRERVAEGVTVEVASLADVIRSKQAAGRAKDQGQLPILRETLERLRAEAD